jgi:uncharacterized protein (DUF1800 family)
MLARPFSPKKNNLLLRPIHAFALTLCLGISACGGGGGGTPATTLPQANSNSASDQVVSGSAQGVSSLPVVTTITRADAVRFLTQASFGPSESDIQRVIALGYSAWIDEQFSDSVQHPYTNMGFLQSRSKELAAHKPGNNANNNEILQGFYTRAMTSPAQLKLRTSFALSEIFVVSMTDSVLAFTPSYMAGYLDMLDRNVTRSYRELLEDVARNPAMAHYLTFMANLKEDPLAGRVPDENFAREIMQLFSIGLYQLNDDGSLKLSGGAPIETYGSDSIQGLAKVFTGWSWWYDPKYQPLVNSAGTSWKCFYTTTDCRDPSDSRSVANAMVGFVDYHSTSDKTFLGVTVSGQTPATPDVSMRIALDTIAGHANVAPFISKQLIQRFVTSNPTPAYVGRVAAVFKSSGGSIKEVVKAILLDEEARSTTTAIADGFGKVREPVLRVTALLRAFKHKSDAMSVSTWLDESPTAPFYRYYDLGLFQEPGYTVGQTPFMAPSVFNFFRPGYVPPQSSTATAGKVAPEMQLVNEVSVTGYVNAIRDALADGIGEWKQYDVDGKCGLINATVSGHPECGIDNQNRRDVQFDFTDLQATAADTSALFDEVSVRLLSLPASDVLKKAVTTAVSSMPSNTPAALQNRVRATIFLVMASTEFLVQK